MGLTAFTLWAIKFDVGVDKTKSYLRTLELGKLEVCCATDETRKLRNLNLLLHDVLYSDVVDSGRVDLGNQVLQVIAISSVVKLGESGENGPHRGIWTSSHLTSASCLTVKSNEKSSKPGQHSQTSNHRFQYNVIIPGYTPKMESDEVTGR